MYNVQTYNKKAILKLIYIYDREWNIYLMNISSKFNRFIKFVPFIYMGNFKIMGIWMLGERKTN